MDRTNGFPIVLYHDSVNEVFICIELHQGMTFREMGYVIEASDSVIELQTTKSETTLFCSDKVVSIMPILIKSIDNTSSRSRQVFDWYEKHFGGSRENVGLNIVLTVGICQKYCKDHLVLPKMQVREGGKLIVFENDKIYLENISYCYQYYLDECKEMLKQLFYGINIPTIDDTRITYSYSTSSSLLEAVKNGNLVQHKDMTQHRLKHVHSDENIYWWYYDGSVGDENVAFKRTAVKDYVKLFNNILKMIMVIELGSGMPARATELCRLRMSETAQCHRSIYLYEDGTVFL